MPIFNPDVAARAWKKTTARKASRNLEVSDNQLSAITEGDEDVWPAATKTSAPRDIPLVTSVPKPARITSNSDAKYGTECDQSIGFDEHNSPNHVESSPPTTSTGTAQDPRFEALSDICDQDCLSVDVHDTTVIDFSPSVDCDNDSSDSESAPANIRKLPPSKSSTVTAKKVQATKKSAPEVPLYETLSNRQFLEKAVPEIQFQVLDSPSSAKGASCLKLRVPMTICISFSAVREQWLDKMGIPRRQQQLAKLNYRFGVWTGVGMGLETQADWDEALEELGANHKQLCREKDDPRRKRFSKPKEPVNVTLTNAISVSYMSMFCYSLL